MYGDESVRIGTLPFLKSQAWQDPFNKMSGGPTIRVRSLVCTCARVE